MPKMQLKHIPDDLVVELARKWTESPNVAPGVVMALVDMGVPEKLAVKKVEKLSDGRVLEYGVSPYYAWPVIEPDHSKELIKYIQFLEEEGKNLEIGQYGRFVIDYYWLDKIHPDSMAALDIAWEKLLKLPGMKGGVTDELYGRQWTFVRDNYKKVTLLPPEKVIE